MPKSVFLYFLLFILYSPVYPQSIIDSFSDGDFTNNPKWIGNVNTYKVNPSLQLQSNATNNAYTYLSLPYKHERNNEWRFWFKCSFNPTAQNFAAIYLWCDSINPIKSSRAIWLKAGGSSGNSDSLSLYTSLNGKIECLIKGRAATFGKSLNQALIRIRCTNQNSWTLESDTSILGVYFTEGNGTFSIPSDSGYFSIGFTSTSTNAGKFYFDNLYIGSEQYDTLAPQITSVNTIASDRLAIQFSEDIQPGSCNLINFISNDSIEWDSVYFEENSLNKIILQASDDLPFRKTFSIAVGNIFDLSGNKLIDTSYELIYSYALISDAIINEFMPAPTSNGIFPNSEYIEILNTSKFSINLNNWTISDLTTKAHIPSYILLPDSFIVLCPIANYAEWKKITPNVMAISSFPTLNNSGDSLVLMDNNGEIIHHINYTLDDYVSNNPMGRSLECSSYKNICLGHLAYAICTDANGGTPGKANSIVWSEETYKPKIALMKNIDSNQIVLLTKYYHPFSTTDFTNELHASFEIKAIHPISGNQWDSIKIESSTSFKHQQNIELTVDQMSNCLSLSNINIHLAETYIQTRTPNQNEVLISEIFPSPLNEDGILSCEWIELYNPTTYRMDLNCVKINTIYDTCDLHGLIIEPFERKVICGYGHEKVFDNGCAMGFHNFPTLNHSAEIFLFTSNGSAIHQVKYSDKTYHDEFKQNGSWSIEMLNVNNPCDNENWSASIAKNQATPGKENSILNDINDTCSPKLINLFPVNDSLLKLCFNEVLNADYVEKLYAGQLFPVNANASQFYIKNINLLSDSIYTFKCKNVKDCSGNYLQDTSVYYYQKPKLCEPGDLTFSEILFHPYEDGNDFIELFNRSNKYIDLKGLYVANCASDNGLSEWKMLSEESVLFEPNTYLAFTYSDKKLALHYSLLFPERIRSNVQLPSLNNDKGCILLTQDTGLVIDKLSYTDKMHHPLLSEHTGVSLEKRNQYSLNNTINNWGSSSGFPSFATPGYKNSIQEIYVNNKNNILKIYPEIFSPDGDGYDDYTSFQYESNETNTSGLLQIFDLNGKCIYQNLNFYPMGNRWEFSWNGLCNDGTIIGPGLYLATLQLMKFGGSIQQVQAILSVAFNTKP